MKKDLSFSRRTLLRGAGTTLCLPFMEALAPAKVLSQGTAPKRFIGFFYPNGMHHGLWNPEGTGKNWQAKQLLAPMEPYRDKIFIPTGMRNNNKGGQGGGDHSSGIGAFLTGRQALREKTKFVSGSIDQVLVRKLGEGTRYPSMQIATEKDNNNCDGRPCVFGYHISYSDDNNNRGQALPNIYDPKQVFERMFGGGGAGGNEAQAREAFERRIRLRTGALDVILDDARRLKNKISYRDRVRLDEFMSSVNDVEETIKKTPFQGGGQGACGNGDEPPADMNIEKLHDVHGDMMTLALQCNVTNVITFMWGSVTSNRRYPVLADGNLTGGHHNIQHKGPKRDSDLICEWEMKQFAKFVGKLQDAKDVNDSSLLDNLTLFMSSDTAQGDRHDHNDMPVIVAGGASGMPLGESRNLKDRWFSELFMNIAHNNGVMIDSFGDQAKAPIAGL